MGTDRTTPHGFPGTGRHAPGPSSFAAPKSCLETRAWTAHMEVDSTSAAASWLACLDTVPLGGDVFRLEGGLPPRHRGPMLETEHGVAVEIDDGNILIGRQLAKGRYLWAPVVAAAAPWTAHVDGYDVQAQGGLWLNDDNLSAHDGSGADVPPSILARRLGPEALATLHAARAHDLKTGLAATLTQSDSWPPVRPDLATRTTSVPDPAIWEPWRPQPSTFRPKAVLLQTLERVGRILFRATADDDVVSIGLTGAYPLQNGRLAPVRLSIRRSPTGRTQDPPWDALNSCSDALARAGLFDEAQVSPWLSKRFDRPAACIEVALVATSAHQKMEDLAWARTMGWTPPPTPGP